MKLRAFLADPRTSNVPDRPVHIYQRLLAALFLAILTSCSNARAPIPDQTFLPNVRGADVRVVADRGEFEPAPEVLPAVPAHLFIDDCRAFVLFDVPDTVSDTERGILTLNWLEGLDVNRSLTIFARSPSCASHEGVSRLLNLEASGP